MSVYENFYKARLDNWFKRYAINLMVNNELNKDVELKYLIMHQDHFNYFNVDDSENIEMGSLQIGKTAKVIKTTIVNKNMTHQLELIDQGSRTKFIMKTFIDEIITNRSDEKSYTNSMKVLCNDTELVIDFDRYLLHNRPSDIYYYTDIRFYEQVGDDLIFVGVKDTRIDSSYFMLIYNPTVSSKNSLVCVNLAENVIRNSHKIVSPYLFSNTKKILCYCDIRDLPKRNTNHGCDCDVNINFYDVIANTRIATLLIKERFISRSYNISIGSIGKYIVYIKYDEIIDKNAVAVKLIWINSDTWTIEDTTNVTIFSKLQVTLVGQNEFLKDAKFITKIKLIGIHNYLSSLIVTRLVYGTNCPSIRCSAVYYF